MTDLYTTDAYHSLSIEKHIVTPTLIERVKAGDRDVYGNEADRKHRDALAARGYWQAFNAVKNSIEKILDGKMPEECLMMITTNGIAKCLPPVLVRVC